MPQRRDGSYPHYGTSVTHLRPRAACAEGDTDSGMSATPADVRLEENPRLQAHRRQGGLPLGAIVQHIPEWLKERYPWYMQSFNICNYTIDLLAAWGAVHLVLRSGFFPSAGLRYGVAGGVACVTLVGVNHAILAPMMTKARG